MGWRFEIEVRDAKIERLEAKVKELKALLDYVNDHESGRLKAAKNRLKFEMVMRQRSAEWQTKYETERVKNDHLQKHIKEIMKDMERYADNYRQLLAEYQADQGITETVSDSG